MANLNGDVYSDFKSPDYTPDTFIEMSELQPSDISNVQRWKALKAKASKTTDEEAELQILTKTLAGKIVTAVDWNKLCDAMINLQKMYKDKGLDEINETIENYVTTYAQDNINSKLNTMVNNFLVTNAHKIIVSNTTPTVEPGSLWIKPKTN